MKRRSFLTALAALAAAPALKPLSGLAAGPVAGTTAIGTVKGAVPAATYKWAEVIVRAHNSCTPAMLQRLLQVDATVANALQSQLVSNGVISAQANAFGIRSAINPLSDGLFLKPGGSLTPSGKSIPSRSTSINPTGDAVVEHPATPTQKEVPVEGDDTVHDQMILDAQMREPLDTDCRCSSLEAAMYGDFAQDMTGHVRH